MSELHYLIWFAATAVMTITVLAIGTLGAAGLLTRSQHKRDEPPPATAAPSTHASDGARLHPEPGTTQHHHRAA